MNDEIATAPVKEFRTPTVKDRVANIGRTGSGKTHKALWDLSHADLEHYPYYIVNYKRDELLNSIPRVKDVALGDTPDEPGLYQVHPRPEVDDSAVENWLWKIHAKGNRGILFDEAYNVPDKGALRSILTQGRTLHIPVLANTQRPAWVSRFVFSEADYITVFYLTDRDDELKVERFLPRGSLKNRLPDYHFHWYDVKQDHLFRVKPVPSAGEILETISAKLQPKRRWF